MNDQISLMGQWIGNIYGTNKAVVTLNIDEDSPNKGKLLIVDEDVNNPNFYADVVFTQTGDSSYKGDVQFFRYPGPSHNGVPENGSLKLIKYENKLSGDWTTNIGSNGSFFWKITFRMNRNLPLRCLAGMSISNGFRVGRSKAMDVFTADTRTVVIN